MAQLRKFAINCSDSFDIVMLYKLKILFLVFFRKTRQIGLELYVQFTYLVLLPSRKLIVIVLTIRKETD
jgi:hypothetical protein